MVSARQSQTPEMRIIGLQAIHLDSPLHGLPQNISIDVGDLPISQGLQTKIVRWDSLLQSEQADVKFIRTGRRLARDLQRELGEDWKVVYRDNKDVSIPNANDEGDVYWSAMGD